MKENDLYNYLQSLMPSLQFINSYMDTVPLPPPKTDFASFNVLDVSDRGWSQARQKQYEDGIITLYYDVQRIYRVQLDFYGPNSFDNANIFKQNLQVGLARHFGLVDLKSISPIRNLTFLQENKRYMRRYSFDIELFVVDSILKTSPAIERAEVKIINRGNNY